MARHGGLGRALGVEDLGLDLGLVREQLGVLGAAWHLAAVPRVEVGEVAPEPVAAIAGALAEKRHGLAHRAQAPADLAVVRRHRHRALAALRLERAEELLLALARLLARGGESEPIARGRPGVDVALRHPLEHPRRGRLRPPRRTAAASRRRGERARARPPSRGVRRTQRGREDEARASVRGEGTLQCETRGRRDTRVRPRAGAAGEVSRARASSLSWPADIAARRFTASAAFRRATLSASRARPRLQSRSRSGRARLSIDARDRDAARVAARRSRGAARSPPAPARLGARVVRGRPARARGRGVG